MESRKCWFIEQFAKLKIDDERITTLNEIRREFSALSNNDAKVIADKLDLPAVFDCLNDSNPEQIDLACDVLNMCMGQLSLGESTKRFTISLERAIKHPLPHVKLMALKEIDRTASSADEDLLYQIVKSNSLLTNLIRCIADTDLEVSTIASDVVIKMCCTEGILQQMMSPNIVEKFENVIVESEVIKLRIFELITKIAVLSAKMLNILASSGLLSHLLSDLNSNDILFRLNIIELLSTLVSVEHGYNFLKKENIITKLDKQFAEVDSNVEMSFCEPGILKFFGHLGHSKPNEVISQHRLFRQRLFRVLNSDRDNHYPVALDVLGHIAETNAGKIVLETTLNSGQMTDTVKSIVENIPSMVTELRPRALNCLECCFHMSDGPDNQVSVILEHWFNGISPQNQLELILKYVQDPTVEIRLAGLKWFQALCEHSWMHRHIKDTAGTVEFILNRCTERIKEGKEIKYDIAKLLSTSAVLDSGTIARMQQFVREGPFYVETVTEIAIEGNE